MVSFVDFGKARQIEPTFFVYQTPLGRVTIQARGQSVTRIVLGPAELEGHNAASAVTNSAATQVQEYLAGKRRAFDLEVSPEGSDFQLLVWEQLCRIPYGQTMSYAEVAQAIGRPSAYRAVGMAANRNPLLLAIPCHRVVGADGGLVGFAAGLHVKRFLLDLEAQSAS